MKVAKQKLQEIRDLLAQGYTAGKSTVVDQTASKFDLKHFTLRQALTHFCNYKNATTGNDSLNVLEEKYNEQGARISFNTHKDYKTTRKLVLEWLERNKMPGLLVINFNRQACDLFFTYLKEERGVGNKTYNKYRGYLSTVINYYIEHLELLIKNPVAKVEHLRVVESDMHEPVRVEHLQLIRKHLLEKGDKQLFLFVNFLYYTFTRPNEEIRHLQVKDIREKTIFIPSSRAKNNRGEHIGIPVALEKLIQEYKLRELPPDYYVFSNNGLRWSGLGSSLILMKGAGIDTALNGVIEGKRRATLKIDCLLPAVAGLQVTGIAYQEKLVSLSLTTTHPTAHCPICGNGSEKIHSRYQRRVGDLPWSDKQVQLLLAVRRFFCEQEECKRKVFSERLHPAIAAYARRTARLDHHLQTLALLLGGEGAAMLCRLLNTSAVSGDTLLKLTRSVPIDPPATPTVLGIDEWAIKKGQNYATILVDLQTRRPIELLKDAKLETVESWLKAHPGIKIISRDRDTVFAEAGRKGAPEAIQVADRWHLLKNLGDCLKGMLETDQPALRATAAAMQQKKESPQAPLAIPIVEAPQEETGLKTRLRHQQVKQLRAQGWPILRIAKHLRMHRQTVKKYMQLEKVPQRQPHPNARYRHSLTKEQTQYLAKRWQEGNTKPRQIWRELKEQGYKGVASCIYRAIAHLPARVVAPAVVPTILDQKAATRAQRPLSARSAVWLLIRPKEELSQKSQQLLSILLHKHEQAQKAYPLAQQFIQMVKTRKADQLDNWIQEANQTDIAQLKRFTAGLQRDYQAVKAGLSLEWSNGQVEGQINRLKLIKRQTYGRAKLDLLKKRVFYKPARQAA